MLAFQHACRESDREVGDVCASFIEEANAIVEQDQKAIEDRLAAVEAEKAAQGENYMAPQFAAIGAAGNFFLQDEKYTPLQQSLLLGALLRKRAAPGVLKNIRDGTDEELAVLASQFGTPSGADAVSHFNISTHATVPDILGPTHSSTQCHLEFIYPCYHNFLSSKNVKPGFMPADVSKSKHYLIVGGGPVGLTMAIEALLRGHRVTVVDSRKADRRDRYVGVWPKDISKMTQFGIAESAWVVWTVLNATNDRAPKQRRNTSRLFLNISIAVRILTWSAVKLGALVLRGLYFDYAKRALCTTDAESRIISPISFDEVVFATGSVGHVPRAVTEALSCERIRPFEMAQTLLRQAPEDKWESLFAGEPVHCTRYLLDKKKSSECFKIIRDMSPEDNELLSNIPSLFIQVPAECVYGGVGSEEMDLTQSVNLPPGWHITGLTRVTDRKMFKVVIFGPLPGHLGASLATATDPVSIGQSCLASTQTTGSSNQDYCREQLMLAHKKGLVYVINTDFQTMVRTSNIKNLGEKCYDKPTIDLSQWNPASLVTPEGRKQCFVIGDAFSTPWYKLAVGLFDGIAHVDAYWSAFDDPSIDLRHALAQSEYQISRRQLHICTSLVTINTELAEQNVLERLVRDSTGNPQRVRGWSDPESELEASLAGAAQGRARSSGVELEGQAK